VVEGVWRATTAIAQYAVSDSGTMVYMPGTVSSSASGRTLVWVDRKGKEQPIAAQPNDYRALHISPDGTKVALGINAGNNKSDIWIWDLVRETMTRLTFNENSGPPLWTHDGKRVAFGTGSDPNHSGVFWKAADGTGGDERLGPASGKPLLRLDTARLRDGILDLRRWEATANGVSGCRGKNGMYQPKISPDGRWMAYLSDESGKYEIYVSLS